LYFLGWMPNQTSEAAGSCSEWSRAEIYFEHDPSGYRERKRPLSSPRSQVFTEYRFCGIIYLWNS
jgi:hypothetical protein